MQIALGESQSGSEPDDYLIELMGLKDDFPEEALAAYGKIYARYWDIMFAIALNVTHDAAIAGDLLSDTFDMIYNKASTFKAAKLRSQDNIRISIQKWMTVIMQHIFYDHFLDDDNKKSPEEDTLINPHIIDKNSISNHLYNDYDVFLDKVHASEQADIVNSENYEDGEDSENISKVKAYISKLSERDRDIILTLYSYYVPGKYTPAAILIALVQKWGTTKENIRKIMEKFRKTIKEDLKTQILIRK